MSMAARSRLSSIATPFGHRCQRIAEKPGQYYQRIYGLKEVGGTTVLMLSAVPFEQIGLRTTLPQEEEGQATDKADPCSLGPGTLIRILRDPALDQRPR